MLIGWSLIKYNGRQDLFERNVFIAVALGKSCRLLNGQSQQAGHLFACPESNSDLCHSKQS